MHNGHLRLALEVRELLELDAVRLMPAPNPRLRDAPNAAVDARARMVAAAIADEPGLELDSRELARAGPTYTVESLEELRAELPGTALCLILGMDAFARIGGWHRWERLLDLCHLVIAARPEAELPRSGPAAQMLDQASAHEPAALRDRPAGRVLSCPIPLLDISATRIRALLAAGRSVRFLVPDRVHDMLITEGAYAKSD